MPSNLTYGIEEHFERFDSQQACIEYLEELRWNGVPECTNCGNKHMNYFLSTRKLYKCSKCYKQFNVLKGTIFERTKLPLVLWFRIIMMFLADKRGIPARKIAQDFRISRKTTWFMLHRIRQAMGKDNRTIHLDGEVEVDEASFGANTTWDTRLRKKKEEFDLEQERIHGPGEKKRRTLYGKQKRGRKKGITKQMWQQKKEEQAQRGKRKEFELKTHVLVMTERKSKKLVLKTLGRTQADKTGDNIYPHLRKHISPDSILLTDQWNLYDQIGLEFLQHLTVNHEIGYVIDGVHINTAENIWFHVRRMVSTYIHISFQHFQSYMNEFAFRRNRNKILYPEMFDSFMMETFETRLPYDELKNRKLQITAA